MLANADGMERQANRSAIKIGQDAMTVCINSNFCMSFFWKLTALTNIAEGVVVRI